MSRNLTSEAALATTELDPSWQETRFSKPVNDNTSLLDGTYDEKESAASFQQALAEWRAQSGKTSSEAQVYTTKGIGTVAPPIVDPPRKRHCMLDPSTRDTASGPTIIITFPIYSFHKIIGSLLEEDKGYTR